MSIHNVRIILLTISTVLSIFVLKITFYQSNIYVRECIPQKPLMHYDYQLTIAIYRIVANLHNFFDTIGKTDFKESPSFLSKPFLFGNVDP